jgi:hypothetical protein
MSSTFIISAAAVIFNQRSKYILIKTMSSWHPLYKIRGKQRLKREKERERERERERKRERERVRER